MGLSQERQASDESEVTSEMIKAGVKVLQDYDEGLDSQAAVVRKIFIAMAEVGIG